LGMLLFFEKSPWSNISGSLANPAIPYTKFPGRKKRAGRNEKSSQNTLAQEANNNS
jgi:hypothetical protein